MRERGASSQNFTNIITTNLTTDMSEETFHFVGYSTFVNKTVDDPFMGEENEEIEEEEGLPISNYRNSSTPEVVMIFPSKDSIMPASRDLHSSPKRVNVCKLLKRENQLSREIAHQEQKIEDKYISKDNRQVKYTSDTSSDHQDEIEDSPSVVFEKNSVNSSCWRMCK